MKLLSDVNSSELAGKKVFLRLDLNVPVENGVVTDSFRLTRSLKTIAFLQERGARVIIGAHWGRNPEDSLRTVAEALRAYAPIVFVPDCVGAIVERAISIMKNGDVLLLENLRKYEGEKANESAFSQTLASYADIYVNDAFSASHRAHASIVGIPEYIPGYAGLLFVEEYTHLSQALVPHSPSLAILGGAKFDTKEPLIKKMLETYDHLFLGGALVNDVFKAQGFEVGKSLVSSHVPDRSVISHTKLLLPPDVVVEKTDGQARARLIADVQSDEKIVDIGPESFALLLPHIQQAAFITWNGPTGLYEGGYDDWSNAIAGAIAESGAHSVVGGGDTLASITRDGFEEQFTFVSTAGGAMLKFLLEGTLPGISALTRG